MLTTLSIAVVLVLLAIGGVGVFEAARRRFRIREAQPKRPPVYELVKRIEGADAIRALEIFRGDHGLFRFDEMKWHEPDLDDLYEYEYEGYWAPITCSGLYDSAEAAERDARAEIAWLREAADA